MKVAVLGAAGGIGQALALLLKNRLPAGSELSLYDIAPVTPGVAADLSHIPTDVKVTGFCGEDPSPALVGADVVLISAGVARKPGMDRSDLFNINAGIVKNLVEKCAVSCPKALIGIITRALGFSAGQTLWMKARHAARRLVPAYSNEVILVLKGSSLASTITIMDIMGLAQRLNAQTYDTLAVFTVAGGLYLTMNGLLTIGFRWCEKRALAFQS